MCLACYPTTTTPIPPAAPPVRSVRFSVPTGYEAWSCYPSNQLQLIPPPPIVVAKPSPGKEEAPKPAAPKEEEEEEDPAAVAEPEKKVPKPTPSKPPSLKAGATFVYPRRNTYVHLIKTTKVWEAGKGKAGWGFKIHRVPVSLSVVEFGEAVLGDGAAEWVVTEVVELGDGEWSKGTSFKFGDDKAKGTMRSFGWNERRGGELPPVWLVVHTD
ncbi:GrpE, mitochondrial [Sphaceloma murrayae]|uniref:GrpE, mitochondrial n=1 Tax=Sphaceloma murrayae TaxID=2082308 RepID=A0A2K1QMJ3_9PEZI|nr:GrpE, mitochondrial [Sphaceloma murrayae]